MQQHPKHQEPRTKKQLSNQKNVAATAGTLQSPANKTEILASFFFFFFFFSHDTKSTNTRNTSTKRSNTSTNTSTNKTARGYCARVCNSPRNCSRCIKARALVQGARAPPEGCSQMRAACARSNQTSRHPKTKKSRNTQSKAKAKAKATAIQATRVRV